MNYIASIFFRPKIPVICLRQNITQAVSHSINRQIRTLNNIKAIAIVIDSEKGEPVQIQLLANSIKQLSKKHNVPIYSFVQTQCTGQSYYLVSIANKSFCLPSSIVGAYRNVDWFGLRDFFNQNNVEVRSWLSFKNQTLSKLSPFENLDKHNLKSRIQQIQQQMTQCSIKNIKHNNKQSNQIALDTQYLIGDQAVSKGYINSIGNFYVVLQKQFPNIKFKFIEHSTILKKYLGVALALPFIAICLLLGTKSLLKYSTILGFYLIFKKKDNKEKKTQKL